MGWVTNRGIISRTPVEWSVKQYAKHYQMKLAADLRVRITILHIFGLPGQGFLDWRYRVGLFPEGARAAVIEENDVANRRQTTVSSFLYLRKDCEEALAVSFRGVAEPLSSSTQFLTTLPPFSPFCFCCVCLLPSKAVVWDVALHTSCACAIHCVVSALPSPPSLPPRAEESMLPRKHTCEVASGHRFLDFSGSPGSCDSH